MPVLCTPFLSSFFASKLLGYSDPEAFLTLSCTDGLFTLLTDGRTKAAVTHGQRWKAERKEVQQIVLKWEEDNDTMELPPGNGCPSLTIQIRTGFTGINSWHTRRNPWRDILLCCLSRTSTSRQYRRPVQTLQPLCFVT